MQDKQIKRFISTHPDEDHISGLEEYDDEFEILNFIGLIMKQRRKNKSPMTLRDTKSYAMTLKNNSNLKKIVLVNG